MQRGPIWPHSDPCRGRFPAARNRRSSMPRSPRARLGCGPTGPPRRHAIDARLATRQCRRRPRLSLRRSRSAPCQSKRRTRRGSCRHLPACRIGHSAAKHVQRFGCPGSSIVLRPASHSTGFVSSNLTFDRDFFSRDAHRAHSRNDGRLFVGAEAFSSCPPTLDPRRAASAPILTNLFGYSQARSAPL